MQLKQTLRTKPITLIYYKVIRWCKLLGIIPYKVIYKQAAAMINFLTAIINVPSQNLGTANSSLS